MDDFLFHEEDTTPRTWINLLQRYHFLRNLEETHREAKNLPTREDVYPEFRDLFIDTLRIPLDLEGNERVVFFDVDETLKVDEIFCICYYGIL